MILDWINKVTRWLDKQKYGVAIFLGLTLFLWPTIICTIFLEEKNFLLNRSIIATTQTTWFTLIYFAHRRLPDGGIFGQTGKEASAPGVIICIIAGFVWVFLGMPFGGRDL